MREYVFQAKVRTYALEGKTFISVTAFDADGQTQIAYDSCEAKDAPRILTGLISAAAQKQAELIGKVPSLFSV